MITRHKTRLGQWTACSTARGLGLALWALLAGCRGEISSTLSGKGAAGPSAVISGVDRMLGSGGGEFALDGPCSAAPVAYLYKLGEESKLGSKPLTTVPLASDGSYTFDLEATGLPPLDTTVTYSVVVKSCAGFHARIVTQSQGDLTASSSLMVYAMNTPVAIDAVKAFDGKKALELDSLVVRLGQAASEQQIAKAYDALANDAAMSAAFTTLLAVPVTSLKNAPPQIIAFATPDSTEINEGDAASFGISASHWDKDYKVSVVWQVDDVTLSTERNFAYHPAADSQGLHTVAAIVGRSVNGTWDDQSPYQKYAMAFKVLDKEPATPPKLQLASRSTESQPPIVRERSIVLNLVTGKGLSECASFSRLAITENSETKPSDFPLRCDTEGSQTLAYTLMTSGDGPKTLRLWAADSAGNISKTAAVLILTLDTAPLTFTSLPLANAAADGYLNAAERQTSSALTGTVVGTGFDVAGYQVVGAATPCDGSQSYGAAVPQNTASGLTADGLYKVCVKLTNILDAPPVYGASPNFTLSTSGPSFTSLALAGEAADGMIASAERSLAHALVGSLTATGYVQAAYALASVSASCSQVSGYNAALPLNNSAAVTADGAYKVCALLADAAGNTAYGESGAITFDTDPPHITSLALTGAAADGLINAAEHGSALAMVGTLSATGYTGSPGYKLATAATACDGGLTYTSSAPTSDSSGFGADGSYKVCLKLSDSAGNVAYAASAAITLDTVAPSFASLDLAGDVVDGYLNAAEKTLAHALASGLNGSGYTQALYAVATAATACSGPLSYASSVPVNTSAALTTDGSYKVCAELSDAAGNAVYGESLPFDLVTTHPVFNSVALAGEATDGRINAAEHLLTHALVDTLSASGYASVAYTLAASASACSSASGYAATVPQSDDTRLSTDGTYQVCIRLVDTAGNLTYGASAAITLDMTQPGSFTIAAPATLINTATPTVSWSGATGAATYELKVATAAGCASPVQNYSSVASTSQVLTTLTDGAYYLCLTAADAAGNKTDAGNTDYLFTVDTTPPGAFSITAPGAATSQVAPTVTWGSSTDVVTYDMMIDNEATCTTPYVQTYTGLTSTSQALTTLTAGNTYYVCLKSYDIAGNIRLASNQARAFVVDTDVPQLTAFSINGGAATTTNVNVSIALTAADTSSKITDVCVKLDSSTAPTGADACWIAVGSPAIGLSPAKNLTIADLPFQIGYASTLYTLYAWVRDEAQNTSALTASGSGTTGTDKNAINFGPETPPVITSVIAAGSDSPGDPITVSDTTVAAGGDVFIKWRLVGTNPLGATPITLQYSTDDVAFTTLASALANGANGSCTVNNSGTTLDDQATGCYRWASGAPVSTYFRIRILATDSHGLTSTASSAPLNPGAIRVLAGNTDLGLGNSAKAAVFFNAAGTASDPSSFVVTDAGVIYFRDVKRGILKIDPVDEKQVLLIPTTGTSSGDGGPIASATLKLPTKITLDPQNRLLIYDYNRIRRVDFANDRIDTLIGGGASTGDNIDALAIQLAGITSYMDSTSPFAMMPNGDLYFAENTLFGYSPNTGWHLRVYKPSTGKITTVTPSGIGVAAAPTADVATCYIYGGSPFYDKTAQALGGFIIVTAFGTCAGGATVLDPNGVTSAPHTTMPGDYGWYVPSRTGDLYYVGSGNIVRFDVATHTWTGVVGISRQEGFCVDGTPALSCQIVPRDVFVTTLGKLYFIDHGMIRTLDTSNNVVTLYGQSLFYGDNHPATEARFHTINNVALTDSGKVTILDADEWRLREFPRGGNVLTVAGTGLNGAADTTSDPSISPIQVVTIGISVDDFVADPATGDIYYSRGSNHIAYLKRTTNRWVDLVGGGATNFEDADGLPGTAIGRITNYLPRILGFNGTSILSAQSVYDGAHDKSMLKQYTLSDGTQSHVAGILPPPDPNFCVDGTPGTTCSVPLALNGQISRAFYDSYTSQWLLLQYNTQKIRTMPVGGNMGTLATLAAPALSFTYHRNADASVNEIFYCSPSGRLRRFDLNTSADTQLTWAIPSMTCVGKSLAYDAVKNSIIFPYSQNGLAGVAEYSL